MRALADAEAKHGEVKISTLESVELSPISSADSWGYKLVERAALEVLKKPEVCYGTLASRPFFESPLRC